MKGKRTVLAKEKGNLFRQGTAMVTQHMLNELECEVLSYPLYSPEIAPSDYCLFRSH